jgi:N-acylneuraminate cytidylyltransferase
MKKDIVFFIPTRKGSERVVSKNTRKFSNIDGGLLGLKLKQILNLNLDFPIVLSTNDENSIEVALKLKESRINIIERPEQLCLSSTNINEFINYIPTIFDRNKHVFWLHTTTPFVNEDSYLKAVKLYQNLEEPYDSLISVTKIQQFLWDPESNECLNYDRSSLKWPRTQDLKVLYEINHAFYINSIENYLKLKDRIGAKPYYFELDKLQSFDIDWEEDFIIAEKIFNALNIEF